METSLYPKVAQDVKDMEHPPTNCTFHISHVENMFIRHFYHKTLCQNKSLSPMSLFLAVNQYFVILYLSKQIYMCKMNKSARGKQTNGSPDHSPGIHQKLQHRQHHHLQTKLRNLAPFL